MRDDPSQGWTVRQLLRADFEAAVGMDPTRPRGTARRLDVLSQPGFLLVVLYRLAASAHARRQRVRARLLLLAQTVLLGAEVYPGARIGPGMTVTHPVGIGIGAGVVIGRNARIHGMVRIGTSGRRVGDGFPAIGDECVLYDGCRLFGPITVGHRVRIGTQALVLRDLPDDAVVVAAQGEVVSPAAGPERAGLAG